MSGRFCQVATAVGSPVAQENRPDTSTLNAYFCHLEGRTTGLSCDPPEPGEYGVPCGVYVAATRGQAKLMLLADHWRTTDPDEYTDVRTNLLERGVPDCEPGEPPLPDHDPPDDNTPDPHPYYRLWGRVHEVQDHGGNPCDCPAYDAGDASAQASAQHSLPKNRPAGGGDET